MHDNRNILRDHISPKVLGRGVKVLKDAMDEEGHESEPMWYWSWENYVYIALLSGGDTCIAYCGLVVDCYNRNHICINLQRFTMFTRHVDVNPSRHW